MNCNTTHYRANSSSVPGDPNFVLGDRDGTACAPEFTALVATSLRGFGYAVAVNDPYKGVELVRRHGRPAERRHSLQVEVKRTLYMNEITLEPNAGYERLAANLDRLVASVAAYVRDACRSTARR